MTSRLKSAMIGLAFVTLIIAPSPRAQSDSTSLDPQQVQHMQDSVFVIINQHYQSVRPIFEHSCFDCHSKYTKYPWYHKLPLIKGLIDSDIKEASEQVDFSADFPFTGEDPLLLILRHLKQEIKEGDMPPWNYRLMHWGKLIEGARQDSVFQWIDNTESMLTEFYQAAGIPIPQRSAKQEMEAEDTD